MDREDDDDGYRSEKTILLKVDLKWHKISLRKDTNERVSYKQNNTFRVKIIVTPEVFVKVEN